MTVQGEWVDYVKKYNTTTPHEHAAFYAGFAAALRAIDRLADEAGDDTSFAHKVEGVVESLAREIETLYPGIRARAE